jgi:hypothetical protein
MPSNQTHHNAIQAALAVLTAAVILVEFLPTGTSAQNITFQFPLPRTKTPPAPVPQVERNQKLAFNVSQCLADCDRIAPRPGARENCRAGCEDQQQGIDIAAPYNRVIAPADPSPPPPTEPPPSNDCVGHNC